MIDRTTRDFEALVRSLKTLQAYIEMSKQGRLEFVMDIPTQLFKIFFDRNMRNGNTTLFERVFKDETVDFHPLNIAVVGSVVGLAHHWVMVLGAGDSYSNSDTTKLELVHLNAPRKMSFEEWQDQIIHTIVYGDIQEAKTVKCSLGEIVADIIKAFDSPRLARLSDLMTKELLQRQGYSVAEESFPGIELDDSSPEIDILEKQNFKVVNLSIENFIRAIRHKDSAHADPMDNPKWQDEYDQFNATKAISHWFEGNESKVTNENFLIDVAEYLVWQLNNLLLTDESGQ